MTGRAMPPSEELLHAYVDGVLPEERRPEVEAYLSDNPAEARRVEVYRQQNDALQALGRVLAAQPVPERRRRRRVRALLPLLQAAAVLALVALGAAGGWWLRGWQSLPGEPVTLVEQAATAHRTYVPEVLHPVEVTAEQEQHLVTWLSNRLGEPLDAPHLGEQGFRLVGGRLLPSTTGPAGQFMYQDDQGNRLTLYVLSSQEQGRTTAFRYLQKGPVGVFYWLGGKLDYALAGEMERKRLLDVATAVYRQLQEM